MPERLGTAEISYSIFNPFPGLRAFELKESYLYFGRERQIDDLLRRLRSTHFLSVVGTSGCGKSSLVRAGLVPALHSGYMAHAGSSWRVAIMRPGGSPIRNLATALADRTMFGEDDGADDARAIIETTLSGSSRGLAECVEIARIPEHDNALVVVDQFEELFRYKQSAPTSEVRDEAVAFVKLLLTAAAESPRLYVVITMRSDFIGDCMEFPRLPEAINEGQYLVPRMTRDELRQAITGPVGVRSARISPRLVARLLNDVGDNPDQLPVLQHALMRMWTGWERSGSDDALDLGHYREIGTMREALSRHAEQAYGELEEGRQRTIAERMWKALTEVEPGGRGVRRPARLDEICEIADAELEEVVDVIDRFRLPGRSFLMPPIKVRLSADSIIDLSHESLMRNWDRLKRWTTDEAAAARMYRRLATAARRHQAGEAGLWRSPELDLGLRWREETRPTAAWARRYDPRFERAITFLDASVRDRDEALARRERARRRKVRAAVAFAATIILMLAAFLWYADRERLRQRAFSVSLTGDDPLLRAQVLSAVSEPLETLIRRWLGRPREADGGLGFEALRRAAYDPIPRAIFRVPASPGAARPGLEAVAVSPGGRWIVIGAADGRVWIWRSDGREDAKELVTGLAGKSGKAHAGEVTSVAFSPRGDRIATASRDGTTRIWSVEGELIQTLAGHGQPVWSAWFSPDGEHVVTASDDETARLWRDGREVDVWDHGAAVTSASFHPDGQQVLTVSSDRTARLWRRGSTESVRFEHRAPVKAAVFDPRGERVVTTSLDRAARIWSMDGRELAVLEHPAKPASVSFDAAGERLMTSSSDHAVRIWDLGSGELESVLAHGAEVTAASFTSGGRRVVTASADGTARIWTAAGEELWRFEGHLEAVTALALSEPGAAVGREPPADPFIVTVAEDGTARVWPFEPGEPRRLGRGGGAVTGLAVYPATAGGEPAIVVTTSSDGTASGWRFAGRDSAGETLAELKVPGTELTSVSFSPDGDRIAAGGEDGAVRIWRRSDLDGSNPQPAVLATHGELETDEVAITDIAFNPQDGDEMATASADKTTRIWRRAESGWQAGEIVAENGSTTTHGSRVTSVTFDPRGQRLLTASFDGTAKIWGRGESGSWRLVTSVSSETESPEPADADSPEPLIGADFRPAGDEIVTASPRAVRIWRWDGDGWQRGRSFQGHREPIIHAAFGPQGDRVVTASRDGTVRVWSVRTGIELYTLEVGGSVRNAALLPDGFHLLTGSGDGAVRLWRITEADLRSYLAGSNTACMTVEERCLYLDQSERKARSLFVACEKAHGRTPPAELGSCP